MEPENNETVEICVSEVREAKPELPRVRRGRPKSEKPQDVPPKVPKPMGRPRKEKPIVENEDETDETKVTKKRKPKTKLKEFSLWRDDKNEYFRQYLRNRPTGVFTCPHCSNTFITNLKLLRHIRCSVMCKKLRAPAED